MKNNRNKKHPAINKEVISLASEASKPSRTVRRIFLYYYYVLYI